MTATTTISTPEMWAAKEAQLLDHLAESAKRIAALEALVKKLQRYLFGKRSERIDPNQALFAFVEAELTSPAVAMPPFVDEAPDAEEPAAKPKRGHGRRLPPADLPRQREEILPPEAERHCGPCGVDKVKIGEDLSSRIDYQPSSLFVHETARVKLSCPKCQIGVAIAPLAPSILPKGEAGDGLLAHVVTSKYVDHLPLHRQEAILARHGIDLDRSTMCDWVAAVAAAAQPVYDVIRAAVLTSYYVHFDDTPVKVQDRSLKGSTAKGYVWPTVAEDGDLFFSFSRHRDSAAARRILGDYRGFIQADACGAHDDLFKDGTRVEVACWAHARRYFFEARGSAADEAAHALAVIQQLYRVETTAREGGRDPDRTRALRQERSKPLLLEFEQWLDEQARKVPPKSPLGEAVGYTRNQWLALKRYLEDGRLVIDNNPAENAIRPLAVGRKNWLFCGSFAGGERAAVLYTLVANCKAQQIDPFAYLRDLFGRLPHATTPDDYAQLTPRAWKAARDRALAPSAV